MFPFAFILSFAFLEMDRMMEDFVAAYFLFPSFFAITMGKNRGDHGVSGGGQFTFVFSSFFLRNLHDYRKNT